MKSALWVFFVSALLGQAAVASGAKERLVMEPYPGDPPWHEVTHNVSGEAWLREQIPLDQDIDAYKDILTAQSFPKKKRMAPSDFLKDVFFRVSGACETVRVNGPTARKENGYAIAYAQIYCGQQKGKPFGVNMFFKVIQGADSLYVVQREFRVPPTAVAGVASFDGDQKEQLEKMGALLKATSVANGYLDDSVYVCGKPSADKRCASKVVR